MVPLKKKKTPHFSPLDNKYQSIVFQRIGVKKSLWHIRFSY